RYVNDHASGRLRRFGSFRKLGVVSEWEEHPFEWVEGRRMGILRECRRGPLKWFASVIDLVPRGTGTLLIQRIRVAPNGWLGGLAAAIEIGFNARRGFDRIYRRVDAVLADPSARGAVVDAFEPSPGLSATQHRRLERGIERLIACGVEPAIAEKLADFLER